VGLEKTARTASRLHVVSGDTTGRSLGGIEERRGPNIPFSRERADE
jgi:hypothetical protein